MRRFFVVALALFSPVLTGQLAFGADGLISLPAPQAISPQEPVISRAAVVDIRPSGPPIHLAVGAGTLLHLPGMAHTVFVADPDIANVQVNAYNFVYVMAKKLGTTVLYVQDISGHILLNRTVLVGPHPVLIIRGSKPDDGLPPPAPNFLVLGPIQPAAASAQPQ